MKEPDLFDICANRHRGNPNSIAARRTTNADADRDRVLAAILNSGERGMTCDEIEVALGMAHQSCSARVSELKMRGHVRIIGKRPTRTGCKAAVMISAQ